MDAAMRRIPDGSGMRHVEDCVSCTVRERAQIMRKSKEKKLNTPKLFVALIAVPVACGIEVGSTVSCSLANLEYLDISSLECVRCDDDRYISPAVEP